MTNFINYNSGTVTTGALTVLLCSILRSDKNADFVTHCSNQPIKCQCLQCTIAVGVLIEIGVLYG